MLQLPETTSKKGNINIEALEKELDLISNFEDKKITLSMPSVDLTNGRVALSFKKGPNEYGIYLAPDSDLVERSGENSNNTARALLQHEAAHTWLTNFDATEEMIKTLSKKYDMPPEFVKNIENVVEDCRIEGIWSLVFPGSKRNFSELYKVTLDEIEERTTTKPIDFVSALLIARFGITGGDIIWLESKIPEQVRPYYNRFAQELEKVKATDWRGTQVVTDSILNIFKEIFENRPHQKQGDSGEDKGDMGGGEAGDEGQDQDGGNGKDSARNKGNNEDTILKHSEEAGKLLIKLVPILGDVASGKPDLNIKGKVEEVSNSPTEGTLDESRKNILKLLENIPLSKYPIINAIGDIVEDTFASNKGFESKNRGVNVDGEVVPTYNGPLVQYRRVIKPNPNIKKMLEEIELGDKPKKNMYNSTSGSRLDIRKLIRYEITKDPVDLSKPYLRRIKNTGAEIWILLDISSSMEGDKIDAAKRVLGSIYDSLDGSRYVHLNMFGFYNDEETHVFALDRDLLMKLDAIGGTPTDIAIYYTAGLMKRDKINLNKTLFIITDGYPNDRDSTKDALMYLKSAIKSVNIFTIFISPKDEEAVNIFSPSNWYFNVSSIEDAGRVLERGIRGIVENIKKQLRR